MKITVDVDSLKALYRMVTTSVVYDGDGVALIIEVLKTVRILIYTSVVKMADRNSKEVRLRLNRMQLIALYIHLTRLDFVGEDYYDWQITHFVGLVTKELQ